MKDQHNKQARLLAALIDKKIESKFSVLEASVSRLSKEVKALQPARVRALEKDVKTIKDFLEDFNVKNLEEDIFKEFNEINQKLSAALSKQKSTLSTAAVDVEKLRKDVQEAKAYESSNPKRMLQDMESLKTKTHWLEQQLDQRTDHHLLLERIEELERKLANLKVSHPMIIE